MSTKNVLQNGLVLSRTNLVTFPNVDKQTEELWKAFGRWFQSERESSFKTQEDIANDTGLHVKTISRIENGEPTKRTTVVKLANAVKANVKEALNKAGFDIPSNGSSIPKPILEAIGSEGVLSDNDIVLVANFIKMLKQNGNKKDE